MSYIVPISLGILIFTSVYEFILSLDAIHNKNNVLLLAICVCNACSFVYSVMNYIILRDTTARLYADRFGFPTLIDTTRNVWPRIRPAEILVPIITGICTVMLCFCVFFLRKEYSWAIYKSVHGSMKMRLRYLFYEVIATLLPQYAYKDLNLRLMHQIRRSFWF